jgi:hypothetical protein
MLVVLAMTITAACGTELPTVPLTGTNDPVPLSADLDAILADVLASRDRRLDSADGTPPPITPTGAVQTAGEALLEELRGNNVPPQSTPAPDALVRRVYVDPDKPPTSVWVVVYVWDAGFDCHDSSGGPGSCSVTSFYFVDDHTGEIVSSNSRASG